MARLKLAIIIEGIRRNRFTDRAAQWIAAIARPPCDFDAELDRSKIRPGAAHC